MARHSRLVSAFCFATLAMLSLQSCAEFFQNVGKAVWVKYVHVANVQMFQPRNGSSQFAGVENGSFWAVFDICSVDVQGSALNVFNYDTGNFVIDTQSAEYGSTTPGNINVSSVVMSSQSAQVSSAVSEAFPPSQATAVLPKGVYSKPHRIAIFVREYPVGYHDESMTLRYNGQPQVAAIVQNVSPGNPDVRAFYNQSGSPQIVGTCP